MTKTITIDDLAVMVKKGFDETAKRVNLDALTKDVAELSTKVTRIENILIRAHDNRIYKVEDDIRLIKTKVGIK
ncbi:MAG: hypothetical protein AAB767_00150 [Patescibacteria group bacterium]